MSDFFAGGLSLLELALYRVFTYLSVHGAECIIFGSSLHHMCCLNALLYFVMFEKLIEICNLMFFRMVCIGICSTFCSTGD